MNEQKNDIENKRKKYKGLGEALRRQDFEYFENELKNWRENDTSEFHALKKRISSSEGQEGFATELDALLHLFPKHVLDKETNEILPKVKECFELLLELGAEPLLEIKGYYKVNDKAYLTNMVRESAKLPKKDFLEYLFSLKLWKKIQDTESQGETDLLQNAIVGNSADCIEYLIKEQGFDVNKEYFFERNATPIFFACNYASKEAFDKLLELGADLLIKDDDRLTVLSYLTANLEKFEEEYEEDSPEKQSLIEFADYVEDKYDAAKVVEKPKRVFRTSF